MNDPYIVTCTGRKFPFDLSTPNDICIEDIAHALSHLGRFTGHTTMFYSVAQHCLLVAEKIPGNAAVKLAALLHDAAEAYIGDVSSPLKTWMKQKDNWAYDSLHHTILDLVHRRFGITRVPLDVELYDKAACLFEASGFMGLSYDDLEAHRGPIELWELWQPWEPHFFAAVNVDREFGQVETEFIQRFETLMKATGREALI